MQRDAEVLFRTPQAPRQLDLEWAAARILELIAADLAYARRDVAETRGSGLTGKKIGRSLHNPSSNIKSKTPVNIGNVQTFSSSPTS